jgi:quinol monooxygenase YgiN
VYVDRFVIRHGELETFRRYAAEMAQLVHAEELSYHYYVDEQSGAGTAIFTFTDAPALDKHLDVMMSHFQEGAKHLSSTEIELLGQPSERAAHMAAMYGGTVKPSLLAGFSRRGVL